MRNELRVNSNEDNQYYDFVEKLTDRELLEQQNRYLWNIEKNTTSIKKNVQFFFWVAFISATITVLGMLLNI